MTIGLLEKKLQGGGEGGQNHPSPALLFYRKQPERRRVKQRRQVYHRPISFTGFTKIQKKGHHIMFSVSLGSFKEVKKRPFMLIETHFSIFGAGAVSRSLALCLFSAS